METLRRVVALAKNTGHLERAVVFGSFVTAKSAPNDVDVILVMDDGFRLESYNAESAVVFDHRRAQDELRASVFWIRPGLLIADTLEDFIKRWQRKREGGERGIVEVMND
jgi:predicted nucleotidyltransferase